MAYLDTLHLLALFKDLSTVVRTQLLEKYALLYLFSAIRSSHML